MKKLVISAALATFVFLNLNISFASLPHAPHNGNSEVLSITCESCHSVILPDTNRSDICIGCHDGDPAIAMADHSAAVIHADDPLPWPYGNWSVTCLDCHDPHLHFQLTHLSQHAGDLYIISGTIISIATDSGNNTTTVTYSTPDIRPGWELGSSDWGAKTSAGRGLIFVADSSNPKDIFEIESSNDTVIVLNGEMDTGLITSLTDPLNPTTFGIIYGQYIKSMIDTPNSGIRSVKFFDPNGGFVDGNTDPAPGGFVDKSINPTPEGICQVCHTQTTYWMNDGTGVLHPDDGNENCADCHFHGLGFKPTCEACHGYPPGALVFIPGSTNSLTAGAHDFHVSTLGLTCDDCHYNSAGSGPTHNSNLTVTMGFYSFDGSVQGGNYDGQALVSYDATGTSPATTVLNPATDSKTCSNLYCHGNYAGSGKNASPVWDNPTTAACGTCHGASNNEPPTLVSNMNDGGHRRHAGNSEDWSWMTWPKEFPCTTCHVDIIGGNGPDSYVVIDQDKHVNSFVDWKFDTTDPRAALATYSDPSGTMPPSDGTRPFGTCTNVYCHSDVQPDGGVGAPTAFDTVEWNAGPGSFGPYCTGCHNQADYYHGDGIDTGSHAKHVRSYYFGIDLTFEWSVEKCTICHKWNPAADRGSCAQQCHDTFEKIYHVNGDVDVLFDSFASESATYNGTLTPGDAYGSCENLYCHSDGTSVAFGLIQANTSPQWGSPTLACDACHASPPNYLAGSPKGNSHGGSHDMITCEVCHSGITFTDINGITILDRQLHVNGAYDVVPGSGENFIYTYNPAGSSCASISCHAINPDANW